MTRGVEWWERAACRDVDPEAMYPECGDHTGVLEALRVCRGCPVVEDCLREALERRDTHGVRGGLTGDDRKRLLQRRSPLRRCRCGAPTAPKSPRSRACRLCAAVAV